MVSMLGRVRELVKSSYRDATTPSQHRHLPQYLPEAYFWECFLQVDVLLAKYGERSEFAFSSIGYSAAIEGSTRVCRTLQVYVHVHACIPTANSTTPWTWISSFAALYASGQRYFQCLNRT